MVTIESPATLNTWNSSPPAPAARRPITTAPGPATPPHVAMKHGSEQLEVIGLERRPQALCDLAEQGRVGRGVILGLQWLRIVTGDAVRDQQSRDLIARRLALDQCVAGGGASVEQGLDRGN